MTRHRRFFARHVLLLALAATALPMLACTGGGSTQPPKWDSRSVGESIKRAPFTPVVVNSNIGRGPTRLAIALLKQDQTLVLEGKVTVQLFAIDADPEQHPEQGTLLGTYEMTARTVDTADQGVMRLGPLDRDASVGGATADVALRRVDAPPAAAPAHEGALSTIFTAMVDFKQAGNVGAQIQVQTGGKTYNGLLVTFPVLEKTYEPSIGDAAPKTVQKIAKDVKDLSELDSSAKPHLELHDITVADAIASGKPSVVAFVTPAFCQTRFCGPVLNDVVVPVQQQYQGRVHVIHIEPYDLAAARKGTLTTVQAARDWNLRIEPFIAVLDGQGRVAAKFEGIIDLAEVKQAVDAVLAAK